MTHGTTLTAAADALGSARDITELLERITEKARELVGAHQATTSLVIGTNWARSIHAVSLSDKYAAWRTYDEQPDGSGIYRLVCQLNGPMRLTQAELEAHPAWPGFGAAASRHPPMRGWLAVPLTGQRGRNVGVIQLSDKYEGSSARRMRRCWSSSASSRQTPSTRPGVPAARGAGAIAEIVGGTARPGPVGHRGALTPSSQVRTSREGQQAAQRAALA